MDEDAVNQNVAWMRKALHDLCQPLTALQCGLFLAKMTSGADDATDPAELRGVIDESLLQCERLMEQVRAMQLRLEDDRSIR